MNYSKPVIILLFLIMGCSNDEEMIDPVDCQDCQFQIMENSSIFISSKGEVSILPEGVASVFLISFNTDIDQESVLIFEIDPSLEEFEFTGEDLTQISSVEGIADLSSEIIIINSPRFILEGTISGVRINEFEWEIRIENIKTRDGLENFEALFTIL